MSDEPIPEAPDDSAEEAAAASSPRRRGRLRWPVNVGAVGALLVVIVYLHTKVVQVVYVATGSMEPTIQPGDRLVTHLGAYRKAGPQRGDIIAFWAEHEGEYEVKRVVAVGGDRLFVGGGIVIRNGQLLKEPYIAAPMIREKPVFGRVPPGEVFVMGDNRNDSEDSRDYGPIRQDQVLGRVFLRVIPLGRAGPVK